MWAWDSSLTFLFGPIVFEEGEAVGPFGLIHRRVGPSNVFE